jgi:hypothetical protein
MQSSYAVDVAGVPKSLIAVACPFHFHTTLSRLLGDLSLTSSTAFRGRTVARHPTAGVSSPTQTLAMHWLLVVHMVPSSQGVESGSGVQTLGVPLQVKHGSARHASLHPSPAARLPSSHVSSSVVMPSPHALRGEIGHARNG